MVAGVLRGFNTSLDMLLGAAVVLLPSAWLATSVTSGRSAISPAWLGLARYSLAAAGFAVLFALRPDSEPLSVLAGTALALFLPPAVLVWQQRRDNRMRAG